MLKNLSKALRFFRFSEVQKTTSPSTNVHEQLNNLLTEEEIQEQTKLRKKHLQLKHTELQKLVDQRLKLPLKVYGYKDTFSSQYSYIFQRIMAYYRIHPTIITEHLLKIYKASLYSMVDENEEFMNQYWQKGFMDKVLASIRNAKINHTLSIVEDKDFLKNIPETCQILDAVCIRGLSINRQANKPPKEYVKREDAGELGLITFTPKYLTEDGDQFINPDENSKVYEGYENMVVRLLLRIKSPLRFKVKQISVSDEVYTWEHLVIVQNQMLAPKHLESRYKMQSLMEWLGKYRFGVWKVVDIDNFMRGNSLFRPYQNEVEEIDPIFQGTVFDKSRHANIRSF